MNIILFLTLIIYSFGQENKCGNNCTFYVINKTMIINGTGEMYENTNFFDYSNDITKEYGVGRYSVLQNKIYLD